MVSYSAGAIPVKISCGFCCVLQGGFHGCFLPQVEVHRLCLACRPKIKLLIFRSSNFRGEQFPPTRLERNEDEEKPVRTTGGAGETAGDRDCGDPRRQQKKEEQMVNSVKQAPLTAMGNRALLAADARFNKTVGLVGAVCVLGYAVLQLYEMFGAGDARSKEKAACDGGQSEKRVGMFWVGGRVLSVHFAGFRGRIHGFLDFYA